MDLRKDFPRSMRFQLGGYAHLARMIDKCRAVLAGTEGEYIYPCPMDQLLLDYTGIAAESFTDAVKRMPADKAIADWFQTASQPRNEAELAEFNQMILTRGPDTPEKLASFRKTRDAIDPSRTDITSWADLLDLEEGRQVPRRGSK